MCAKKGHTKSPCNDATRPRDLIQKSFHGETVRHRKKKAPRAVLRDKKSDFQQRMRIAVRAVNSTSLRDVAEVQRSFISKAN